MRGARAIAFLSLRSPCAAVIEWKTAGHGCQLPAAVVVVKEFDSIHRWILKGSWGWHNLKYNKKMQRHLMDYSSKKSITWLNIHPVGRLIFIFFKVVHTFFFHIKEEEVVRLFFWDANVASTEHWELLFSYSFKVVGAWNPGDFHHQVSSLFASLTNYSSSSSCWLLSFSIKVHRQCTTRKAQEQTDEEIENVDLR